MILWLVVHGILVSGINIIMYIDLNHLAASLSGPRRRINRERERERWWRRLYLDDQI